MKRQLKQGVHERIVGFLLLVSLAAISGCGASRPVLYPNTHLQEIGQVKAEQKIDDCIRMANEYQAGSNMTNEIAPVVGAATGAIIGAITGNIGQAAAIGGAGAATATMGMGVMRSDGPDPICKQFVEQCLREKGFQPLGWR